jgi:EAL domain-containing protein (putative c-di-GMP-specific phosphodiesterase class I)
MADALKIDVLAEGVERKEQEILLRDFGCRMAQGFYFSRPVPAEEFTALLEREKSTIR